ncbi:MAG: DUF6286 domain-containing protein [Stackebrandtia sp.]
MRVVNRLLAMLLALALLCGGLLLVVEATTVAVGRPPVLVPRERWYRALVGISLGDAVVLVVSVSLLALGVVLLFLQLRPWRPVRLPADRTGWFLRRRSAQHSLALAVDELPAVSSARARLGRKWKLRVRAEADSRDRDTVREAAVAELERLAAKDTGRLRVRLTRRRVV